MTERKKPDPKKIEQLEKELGLSHEVALARLDRELGNTKIRLDPDLLTPRDLRRARVLLDGRNPFELLDDPIDRVVLITWCLLSREDPSFTWEQAEDTPFSAYESAPSEPDPPTPGTKSEPGVNGTSGSKRKRLADAPASSSAPSSG